MASFAIRDDLAEQILKIAEARRLPVERQLEELLEQALDAKAQTTNARRQMFDRIAAMTPAGVPQDDSVDLIREDRDR
jgi:hypothetical protein